MSIVGVPVRPVLRRIRGTGNYEVEADLWTDYDGNQPYGDFAVDVVVDPPSSTITEQRSYELGMGTFSWTNGIADISTLKFYHTDMIGTTRMMSDSVGFPISSLSAVYTAFGERVTGSANRYGYGGAWGYQTDDTGDFPFQHVGAKYYDPSIGRFLQRDPIGIGGGRNVYAYVRNEPTGLIDPSGLTTVLDWAKKTLSTAKKLLLRFLGKNSPATKLVRPLNLAVKTLELGPDGFRIAMMCTVKAQQANAVDVEDFLDILERGRGRLKPGSGN